MKPCQACNGLGFRSLDDAKLHPLFNVAGLNRRVHPDGRITWEGQCIMCLGSGAIDEGTRDAQRSGLFAWMRSGRVLRLSWNLR
jgi:hypothetical protein